MRGRLFILCMISFCASVIFAQEHKQFNIIVDADNDQNSFLYELKILDNKLNSKLKFQTSSQDSFVKWIIKDLRELQPGKRQILFYVHGMWGGQNFNFNRSYKLMNKWYLEQESSDIGRIVSIKWPGNDFEYKVNKGRIENLAPALRNITKGLIRKIQIYQILYEDFDVKFDLLAHSLGNELVKEMFKDAHESDKEYLLFDQIVLAAPDLDFDIYEEDMNALNLHRIARRTHIYFSGRDLTLEVSKNLNKIDRLGRTGPSNNSRIEENVYFIDVSNVKDDDSFGDLITGHSYFRSSPSASHDMLQVLTGEEMDKISNRQIKDKSLNVFLLEESNRM